MEMNDKRYLYLGRLVVILGVIVFISSIIGIVRSYSPVPYWDMWNGYLGFYLELLSGNYSEWFAQHNEHRIIISRLFFYWDIKYFQGDGWFLLLVNYFIQLANFFILFFLSRALIENKADRTFFLGVCFCLAFSWLQHENFTWGFQSQFFIVYTFALLSFISLSYKVKKPHGAVLSCVFATLATYSMANGLIVFPIIFLLSLISKAPLRVKFIIIFAWSLNWGFYFHDYVSPANHTSFFDGIKEHPIDVFRYLFVYIGSPFTKLTGSIILGEALGVFFVFTSAAYGVMYLIKEKNEPGEMSIIAFLLFVGATAFVTASGRVEFGIGQAISSRYMTPSLLGWCGFLLLFIVTSSERQSIKLVIKTFFFIVIILLVFNQRHVLLSFSEHKFNREMASVSLNINANDEKYTSKVFPSNERLQMLAEKAKKNKISIFSEGNNPIGINLNNLKSIDSVCTGHYDGVSPLTSSGFVKVRGWGYSTDSNLTLNKVVFVNNERDVVGFGAFGKHRPDVARELNIANYDTGWEGYIPHQPGKYEVYGLIGDDSYCQITDKAIHIPPTSFQFSLTENYTSLSDIVIIGETNWIDNGTYMSLPVAGLSAIGSWVNGDSFTGAIRIKLSENNNSYSFAYTTGPSNNGITISAISNQDTTLSKSVLPISEGRWTTVQLKDSRLNDSLILEINDAGKGWGQWIAIYSENLQKN